MTTILMSNAAGVRRKQTSIWLKSAWFMSVWFMSAWFAGLGVNACVLAS